MVTREDVAKRAGVSVSAVSRTMNGRGYVAEDKKMAVLQAVRELGYRPNPAGAVNESAQTNQLCFLCRDTANPFYMELFSHMTGYADELGYTMFLFSKFNANRFCRCRMDGVIVESEDDALMIQKPDRRECSCTHRQRGLRHTGSSYEAHSVCQCGYL